MERFFSTVIFDGSGLPDITDPAMPVLSLGNLTQKEFDTIIGIAAKSGLGVIVHPIYDELEEHDG